MRILVLDARQRSALAATRSLSAAGHTVVVADDARGGLAGASRHAADELVYPSPVATPHAFTEWAREVFSGDDFRAALPMTEVTTDLLVRHRSEWPSLILPFAPIETIDALSDKVELYQRALKLEVPAPRSVIVRESADLAQAVDSIGFPAVLKPHRSYSFRDGRFLPTSVKRVRNRDELDAALGLASFGDYPFLYQSEVPGHGEGVFAFYRHGEPVAWFAHRRLREKPPAGGVSVLSESCNPSPQLQDYARRLLDDAHWHGVAMVEFRVSEAGVPYLMEVNARFWGSLQLAIDSGLDFPRLLIEAERGAQAAASADGYRTGRRLRWLLGDLDRLYLIAKNLGEHGTERLLREMVAFCTPHPLRTRHEIFRWSDPGPALRELRSYVRALVGRDEAR